MAHGTEPGQRNKHAKILSYIPDPLNLFEDNELPSRLSFPGHYHSSCNDQCFLRSSFHLFISFGDCIFFKIFLRAFSLTYKTAQLTLYSLGRGPPEPLFREQSVC